MKLNLPVTGTERTFSKDEDLITTTDLKGAITYYNDNFLRISSFDGEELSHKNHNVVRHPDMPPAAFEDLWRTIKAGDSWMGIVKNRCKNGDHYYVDAYVSPISSGGQTVEYQSVRTVPDREHVERAERLYKHIRAGKAPIKPWHRIGMTLKLMTGFAAVLLLGLGYAWFKFNPPLEELAAVVLLGLGVSYGLARLIGGPLTKLAAASRSTIDNAIARQVYGGSQDEIAQLQLVMHMKDLQINSIVARLNDVSSQLMDIVQTTSRMAQDASDGVAVQQSEITQLASAMTEMVATVQEVARNTSDAADSAQSAEQEVGGGRSEVMATVQSISQVAEDVKQASAVVAKLQEESVHIGAVLDVIRGIAEQTNLLALNAAIEAARAGEQGRGFAVVADEVRSLARRTQESTQEIQAMIESIQSGASDAVSAMDAGRNRVDASVSQAQKAGESLERISEIVSSISAMNIQVASATEEQGAVSEEINRNVNNISTSAEDNASRSHDTQLTVDQLSGFSNHVQTLVAQFRRG